MKTSRLKELIKEEIQTTRNGSLVDKIYNLLVQLKEFNELGLDQQGELSMHIVKLLNRYGIK